MTTPAAKLLSSNDPEPPVESVVRDRYGDLWRRVIDLDRPCWAPLEADGCTCSLAEAEQWARVAGTDGPVEVVSEPT